MKIYDAGCDWQTLTVPPDEKNYVRIQGIAEKLLIELSGGGKNATRSQWQGYTGYQSYGLFIGEREDGMCIRASGHEAKLIEKTFRNENIKPRCTRLDLQITAQTGSKETDFGYRVQQEVERSAQTNRRTARYNLASYKVAGAHSGLTIGSRSSSRYSRFYNKTAEQRGRVAPNLWRYEVEFKGQQAREMHRMLHAASNGYYLALSVVKTTFELHGIDMSWVLQAEQMELPSSYRRNDDERRLEWLRTHVRPTVKKLIDRVGRDEVLRCLDLFEEPS